MSNEVTNPASYQTAVISCCVEFKTHRMGIYGYEYDDCKSKAMYMVKAGSYDKDKYHPMCKRHRDIYRNRVQRAKQKFGIELIYDEVPLQ